MAEDIDAGRLWDDVMALAAVTDPQVPFTRRAFSPTFAEGRRWLAARFRDAGLAVTVDAGGNLVGRREGTVPGLAPIVIGSHSDTVPGGGRFDGIAGVLAGLEVARSPAGETLAHPLEIIDFLAEEPSIYGVSCVGSRAMAGALPETMLAAPGPEGDTLADGIRRCGGEPAQLGAPLRDRIAAFFELHIEQGPVLENSSIPIGIVTDIVGIRRFEITVSGRADHAGTTPMHLRKDALVGAAHVVEWVQRQAAAGAGDAYLVATVGRFAIEPNASNVVPSRAAMTVEVRSSSETVLDEFAAALKGTAEAMTARLGLGLTLAEVSRSPATPCASQIRNAISAACGTVGCGFLDMASGAGHDAVYMAKLGPAGMIFIPCRGGRSHADEEWTEPEQLALGARVLRAAVLTFDQAMRP